MADFDALTAASDLPLCLPTAARPYTVTDFVHQFLAEDTAEQLRQQFMSSCERNKQVL